MPLDSDEGEEENYLKKTNPEDLNNHKNPNEQETKTEREYPSQKLPPTITQTQTKNENLYQFYINNNEGNASDYKFKDNKIDTTKYNIFTFLPKALLFQFMRLANVYFLICAILQCIPVISPLASATALIPILVVLSVSLIREAIEDYSRSKLDKEQNSEPAEVYVNETHKWLDTESGKLKIGEIVEVKQDGTFPADLVLIDSDLPEGICYIETGTLDGEKTLKLKSSPHQTAGILNDSNTPGNKIDNFEFKGKIICDPPNPELYRLNGKMTFSYNKCNDDNNNKTNTEHTIPLDAKQLLLKGAKLRNTGWIVGIVIYTGHNCKIMKNAKEPRIKYSSVEGLMNKMLVFILIVQSVLCILCAILRGPYWTDNLKQNPFINYTIYGYALESFLTYFTYILLLNTMIPISLIITLEIVKLIQGGFISVDADGYSKIREKYIKPNSVSLNEELGIINYIFSDKTGTLTSNKMMFKFCVIGDVCYEFIRENENGQTEQEITFREQEGIIPFQNNEMYTASKINSPLSSSKYPGFTICSSETNSVSINLENSTQLLTEYWQALALCHDCTIQKNNETGVEEYIGMSPDSIELVKTARAQGFILTESGVSSTKRIKYGDENDGYKDIELLQLIEFSSDRKRETVVVKDGSLIKLYIKGADSIIEERLSKNTRPEILAQCKNYVNKFSAQGFRTLFIAMKVLSQSEYETFAKELEQANMNLDNKDEKVKEAHALVENDLYLIGCTIVEDKLQDKVPETIRDLRLAGIKIWMLTGDKMNTAYNIGLSCNLINKDLKTFYIEGVEQKKDNKLKDTNKEEREEVILNFAKEYNKFKGEFPSLTQPQFGILVDEKALLTINEDKDMQNIFLNIAKDAVSVICCRVSPLQKSQVVKMMKTFQPKAKTLSIGDGGNDVSMIMEAHIGVGIYGEEGMRAVQSGDYAIGEFKILHRLLLFHGRTNYIRNSELVQYFFYKNFVFTMIQFIYGFYNNFTGQTIIDDWFITLYNLLFTSLPLGARACIDFDVKPDDGKVVSKMLPFLYLEQQYHPIFNVLNFGLNLLLGTIHCCINFFYVLYTHDNQTVNEKGDMGDLWYYSVNMFTNILCIVSVNLLIYTKYETWINGVVLLLITFVAFIIFLIVVHNWNMFNSVATMSVAFNSPQTWLNIVFVVGFCGLIDLAVYAVNFNFRTSLANIMQRIVNATKGKVDNEENMPKEIKDKLKLYDVYEGGNNQSKQIKIKEGGNEINSVTVHKEYSDSRNEMVDNKIPDQLKKTKS